MEVASRMAEWWIPYGLQEAGGTLASSGLTARVGASAASQYSPKFFFFFLSFVLLGPHPWHMEVSRLGAELEL